MGANTKIEWANDTFNPWIGCTKVAPGCAHCYAEREQDHRYGRARWGPNGTRVMTSEANWRKPLTWNREAEAAGVRRRVFCASLADVFEDWHGPIMASGSQPVYLGKDFRASSGEQDRATMNDLRWRLFALIDATPWLDWLLLTKRPENIRRLWVSRVELQTDLNEIDYRPNVWLGTSVSDQETYDRNAHQLYHNGRDLVPVLFLTGEPLLGPIKLWHDFDGDKTRNWKGCFDLFIAGGESGSEARPMHPEWVRSIRDQCDAAGVAFHFKQWGEFAPVREFRTWPKYRDQMKDYAADCDALLNLDGTQPTDGCEKGKTFPLAVMKRVGKKKAGRMLDGREWNQLPEVASVE